MKRLDGSLKRNLMLEFYWNSRLLEVLDVCCEVLRKIADSDISARSAGGPSRTGGMAWHGNKIPAAMVLVTERYST